MIVERCSIDDLEEIYSIEKAAFQDPLAKETIKRGLENENSFYYALKEDKVIAFLSYDKVLDEAQVISVAVHPAYQGKGYGKKLFSSVLEKAADEKISFFTLEVRSNNLSAVSLYEKLGFKEVGRRKGYYQNPLCDAILMDLQIGRTE